MNLQEYELDWMNKVVTNPATGNKVKVGSLPPEERERYAPKHTATLKRADDDEYPRKKPYPGQDIINPVKAPPRIRKIKTVVEPKDLGDEGAKDTYMALKYDFDTEDPALRKRMMKAADLAMIGPVGRAFISKYGPELANAGLGNNDKDDMKKIIGHARADMDHDIDYEQDIAPEEGPELMDQLLGVMGKTGYDKAVNTQVLKKAISGEPTDPDEVKAELFKMNDFIKKHKIEDEHVTKLAAFIDKHVPGKRWKPTGNGNGGAPQNNFMRSLAASKEGPDMKSVNEDLAFMQKVLAKSGTEVPVGMEPQPEPMLPVQVAELDIEEEPTPLMADVLAAMMYKSATKVVTHLLAQGYMTQAEAMRMQLAVNEAMGTLAEATTQLCPWAFDKEVAADVVEEILEGE